MSDEYVALMGRLEQTLFDLDRVVSRTEKQMKQAVATNDDAYLDAAALNLHGFYAGVERAFEDIAQTMSEALPSGSHWHQNLLLQMSNELSGIRPAIITVQTRYCLDEYRQFRHVVRNVYTLNFRLSSIQSLVTDLRTCLNFVTKDLNNFIQFLQQLVND